MNTVDSARQQAQREHDWNQNPSNTHAWDASARAAYENERGRLQKQAEESKQKSS